MYGSPLSERTVTANLKNKTFARQTAALLLLICFVFPLSACGSGSSTHAVSTVVPSFPPLPQPDGLRIAVASDLHLDPDNRPDAAEPSVASYSLELVDALLWDARLQSADIILLTGDLCNGGKPHRHEALTDKLYKTEAEGMAVYVLPGNHDLAPVAQSGFAALYADFGYSEAFSRDVTSLSYCVVRDSLMIIMLDTAGYSIGAIDLPGAVCPDPDNPFLTDTTLLWLERMLQEAASRNLHVLIAGHYNLLPETSRDPDSTGYYLVNGDRFSSLLREYGVPLYLSGHIHTRSVYQEAGLTELTTEYLLAYPSAYSVLDLSDDGITYHPRRIDVDSWASENSLSDPLLLNYSQWQQDGLLRYSESNVEYMSARNPLNDKEKKAASEFFYRTMNAYWQGTLYRERYEIEALPGCELFFRCAEGYAYGWWLKNLIENSSPMTGGFSLPWTESSRQSSQVK